jgi:hypothetical protein
MKKIVLLLVGLSTLNVTAQKYIDTKPGNSGGAIKVWNEYETGELTSPQTYPGPIVQNFQNYLKVTGLIPNQYYSYRTLYGIKNSVISDNYDNIIGISSEVENQFNTSSTRELAGGNFRANGTVGNIFGIKGYAQFYNSSASSFTNYYGVYGYAFPYNNPNASAYGIYGSAPNYYGNSKIYAGYFEGKVHVNGTLTKSAGTFKIDHPLDPQNKYLSHSFVESPDMMNVYNGNIITDAAGKATVTLPDYFEALNMDFRYQLTAIGKLCQVAVMEEVKNNEFIIISEKPNTKVSWHVTGIRNDAYARKNRIKVEEDKSDNEKGKYLNPESFGLKREDAIHFVKDEK